MIPRVALALALLTAPWPAIAETAGSGLVIEIKDGQLVTMSGQAASLARLVSELCAKSGTTLRGYEAADRPITVSYQDVPLREVLQRMLRDETYMLGVRSSAGAANIAVSWLHVTGSKNGGAPAGVVAVPLPLPTAPPAAAPTSVPGSMAGFGVSSNIIAQALGGQNALERHAAASELAEHLETNPGEMDAFLANDIGTIAEQLAGFPYANEALRALSLRQKNPVAKAKLDTIVASWRVRRNEPSKEPSFVELLNANKGVPR